MLNYQNNVSLISTKDIITKAYKRGILSDEDKILEHQRGLFAGMDAKKISVEECADVIIKKTLSGNFDYLKGFNQAIGKDMAKKAYSLIKKGEFRG